MKENKKGFTLIELLAVLVVLAILALITVPIVLNIINQAREKARLRSVEGFAKAVESAVYVYQMENPSVNEESIVLIPDATVTSDYTVGNGATGDQPISVEYSGTKLTGCSLTFSDNKVQLSNCSVEGDSTNTYTYNVTKDGADIAS